MCNLQERSHDYIILYRFDMVWFSVSLPLSHHCAVTGELLIPDFLQFPIPPLQQLLARFRHCVNSPLQKQWLLRPAVAETPAAMRHSFAASPNKGGVSQDMPPFSWGTTDARTHHTSCEYILQVCAVCTRHSGFKNHWRSKIDFSQERIWKNAKWPPCATWPELSNRMKAI
jgi:hypothetical protein